MRKTLIGLVLGFAVFVACGANQIGPMGDIFSVIAGNGLTGGALSGDATLNIVATANRGLTVNADDIGMTPCSSAGETQVWNGSQFACAAVGGGGGGGDLTELLATSGGLLTVTSGTGPIPSVGITPCVTTGHIPKWNGSAWACAADTDTNTTYTAGSPLFLSGTQFILGICGASEILKMDAGGTSWGCASISSGAFSIAGTGLTSSGPTVNANARQRAAAGDWGIEIRADDIGLTDNCANGQVLMYDDGSGGIAHTGEWDCVTPASGGVSGGTADYIPKWLGSSSIGVSNIFDDSATNEISIAGTTANTSIFYGANEDTYIRGGKAASVVYIGDITNTGGVVLGSATNNTSVLGAFSAASTAVVGTTLGVGTNLSVGGNVGIASAGQLQWPASSPDLALVRTAASQLVVTDGAGTATTDYADIAVRNSFAQTLFKTISTGEFEFSSTSALSGATDVAISRALAGMIEITSGTPTTYRDALARFWYSTSGHKTISTGQFEFASTTAYNGATDVAFRRNAAGVVEINSGTSGTLRDLTLRNITSSTTGTFNGNVVLGDTSGDTITVTGAATFGTTLTALNNVVVGKVNANDAFRDTGSLGTLTGCNTGNGGFTHGQCTATATSITVNWSTTRGNTPSCTVVTKGATKSATWSESTAALTISSATSGQVYVWDCWELD